jgi:NADPH:quinone reductase-like Zn-dependent oxidoreductase
MRAVVIKSFGSPEEVVDLDEAQIPEAGAGELRIKLLKSPIHNRDLAIIQGSYGYNPDLPATSVRQGRRPRHGRPSVRTP